MCMPASARGQRLSGSAITPPYDAQVGSMHFRIFRKRGQGETRQCIKHQTLNGNMWVGQGQTHWKMCIHIYIYIYIVRIHFGSSCSGSARYILLGCFLCVSLLHALWRAPTIVVSENAQRKMAATSIFAFTPEDFVVQPFLFERQTFLSRDCGT